MSNNSNRPASPDLFPTHQGQHTYNTRQTHRTPRATRATMLISQIKWMHVEIANGCGHVLDTGQHSQFFLSFDLFVQGFLASFQSSLLAQKSRLTSYQLTRALGRSFQLFSCLRKKVSPYLIKYNTIFSVHVHQPHSWAWLSFFLADNSCWC